MSGSFSQPQDQPEAWQQAIEFLREGIVLLQANDLAGALSNFRLSISFFPTAEGYTHLAQVYARLHLHPEAMAACEQAIDLDPDQGGAYHELGVCLMKRDRLQEAIPWLERAIASSHYGARQLPLFNLGQIYERLGRWNRAIHCFRQAADLAPDFEDANLAWKRLQAKLN